jgi:tRNA pseudouridine55 synthase
MHGWLILDKPTGLTSAQAVARVKKLLKPKKIGHAGTLDPFASGILPLALGEATKTMQCLVDSRKTYRFEVRWGEERTTDDIEGAAVNRSDRRPSREEIVAVLPQFVGNIMQAPPAYSALKVNGERAYNLARAGKLESLPPRAVMVHELQLVRAEEGMAELEMTCGKGTYVRALARDLGRKLSCLSYVSVLRRTQVGKFGEPQAISLAKLEELMHTPAPIEFLHSVESALDDIPAYEVDSANAGRLRQGRAIPLSGKEGTAYARQDGKVIALGKVSGGVLKPVRVFNY